jgi:hypothetical protein
MDIFEVNPKTYQHKQIFCMLKCIYIFLGSSVYNISYHRPPDYVTLTAVNTLGIYKYNNILTFLLARFLTILRNVENWFYIDMADPHWRPSLHLVSS